MYRFNDNLIKNTFSNLTQDYILNQLYNDKRTIQGFLTNATLSPNSSYHFHSLDKFNRGDILTLDNSYYMITGDIVNDRVSKYKGIADYCNFSQPMKAIEKVMIGIDDIGRPVYQNKEVDKGTEYGILRYKDISIQDNQAINFADPIYTLYVRDIPKNRDYFTINKEITVEDKILMVYNLVYTKQGLLEIRLQ